MVTPRRAVPEGMGRWLRALTPTAHRQLDPQEGFRMAVLLPESDVLRARLPLHIQFTSSREKWEQPKFPPKGGMVQYTLLHPPKGCLLLRRTRDMSV